MEYNWKSWWRSLQRNNYFVIKLGASVLLVGLAFTLLYNRSSDFSPVSHAPFLENTQILAPPVISVNSQKNTDQIPTQGRTFYTNRSCSFIEDHQNCMKNGRMDTDYLYWRWTPRGCELPRLDPEKFLDLMRNKSWAFIGDSISRNHVQSFLCILSTVEKAIEVYHDENYKSRKWVFPSSNFTISVLWSPFLAESAIFEDINGVSTSEIELHLDILDKNWTEQYKSLDYMIFSGGKWTSTPDHFEGGEWFNGGTCKRKLPAKEGEFELNELNRILRDIELEEFEKASIKASENGVNFRLLDVSPLSLLRPDGHPGPYRFFQPFAKDKNAKVISDCLHWCLPGPIDSWNDILMEMIVNG
ncbi:hypothetical protein DH2020_028952 [Rehmannia glutinosa]|uniref:Trichome birefringence-like N-terminal domain-containing protein n=1 Tax=Rehmannia glutinosa TaxID=99300 RepID=A0ABR0VTJ3_REHGL